MLFRLGMSIEDAIDAYTVLAKQVFSEKKRLLLREEMFKATRLEEAVIGIIQMELKLGKDQAKGVRMLDEKMVKWCVTWTLLVIYTDLSATASSVLCLQDI